MTATAVLHGGGFTPVSQKLLDDCVVPTMQEWLARELARYITARLFGEDWTNAQAELDQFEVGHVAWDIPTYDDDDEDDW